MISTILFKEIKANHPELPTAIAPSIGKATKHKIQSVVDRYNATGRHLLGCFISDSLVGIIGLEIEGSIGTIRHIAVIKEYRNKGIGKKMIEYAAHYFTLTVLYSETDKESLNFYNQCGFNCAEFPGKYNTRYQCILKTGYNMSQNDQKLNLAGGKKNLVSDNMLTILDALKNDINQLLGFHEGTPKINYGPCGVFAQLFYEAWNRRFTEKVHICFVMTLDREECDHVVIRLPSGVLYDGGIGVHSDKFYATKFVIDDMLEYDQTILEKWSYGLDRTYPRFCPDFNKDAINNLINYYLDKLEDHE